MTQAKHDVSDPVRSPGVLQCCTVENSLTSFIVQHPKATFIVDPAVCMHAQQRVITQLPAVLRVRGPSAHRHHPHDDGIDAAARNASIGFRVTHSRTLGPRVGAAGHARSSRSPAPPRTGVDQFRARRARRRCPRFAARPVHHGIRAGWTTGTDLHQKPRSFPTSE